MSGSLWKWGGDETAAGDTGAMSAETTIRPMMAGDLGSAQALLGQLGYPMEPGEAARRFETVIAAPAHSLLVAEVDGGVCGLVHVFARPALEKPPEAVVQSLVIDETVRGTGIGRKLMAAAEGWAREHGFETVAVATQVARSDANAFYERLGYERAATSHLLRKRIESEPG